MIERAIVDEWENAPSRDGEGKELLWQYYKTAKKFRGILEGVMRSGEVMKFNEKPEKTFLQNIFPQRDKQRTR